MAVSLVEKIPPETFKQTSKMTYICKVPRPLSRSLEADQYKDISLLGAAGSRGMWAKNSLGGSKKPRTWLWVDVSSHNKLAARAVQVA